MTQEVYLRANNSRLFLINSGFRVSLLNYNSSNNDLYMWALPDDTPLAVLTDPDNKEPELPILLRNKADTTFLGIDSDESIRNSEIISYSRLKPTTHILRLCAYKGGSNGLMYLQLSKGGKNYWAGVPAAGSKTLYWSRGTPNQELFLFTLEYNADLTLPHPE